MSTDEQELTWKINNVREAISLDWKNLVTKNLTADRRKAIREHLNICNSTLVLLSQKVAGEVRSDSGKGRDSDISRWGLIWISERQTTVNRDLRGMSRGL